MGRHILTVLAGILISILAGAGAGDGYLIYQLSAQWPQTGPALARYALSPIIAILVGVCVGALAKSSRRAPVCRRTRVPLQQAASRRANGSHAPSEDRRSYRVLGSWVAQHTGFSPCW